MYIYILYITFVTDSPLMMAQSRAESTRDTYNYGQYLNQFPPNTIKVIREFERIQKRICRPKMSIMFNEICINEEMLPKYTYILYIYSYTLIYTYYIYIYTNIYTYIYIYISVYVYIIYICIYICVCVYIYYKYLYTNIYIYIYMCVYMCECVCV